MKRPDIEISLKANAVDAARLLLSAVIAEDHTTYQRALDQMSRYWSRLGHEVNARHDSETIAADKRQMSLL